MSSKQLESITKAAQCAELLASDLRDAHKIACDGEPTLEILLLDLIGDARKLKDRLSLIETAVAAKAEKVRTKKR